MAKWTKITDVRDDAILSPSKRIRWECADSIGEDEPAPPPGATDIWYRGEDGRWLAE